MKSLFAAIVCLFLTSCSDGLCGNELISSMPNYDGSMEAVVFVRNCGATTDFSTHVSILSLDDRIPRDTGNTFIADSDHGKAFTDNRNALKLDVQWLDRTTISIKHSSGARVFRSENSVNGIEVVIQAE